MRRRTAIGLALATATLLAAGCGPSGTAPTLKVTGKVTYNGQAVEGVTVNFSPQNGRPATGSTNASGEFTLSTFAPGDGAVPGVHTVAIAPGASDAPPPMPGTPEAENPRAAAASFPPRYSDPKQSGLTATVEEGGKNYFEFNLTD